MREWKTRSNAGRQSRAMRLACSGLALVPARHTTQAPVGFKWLRSGIPKRADQKKRTDDVGDRSSNDSRLLTQSES